MRGVVCQAESPLSLLAQAGRELSANVICRVISACANAS